MFLRLVSAIQLQIYPVEIPFGSLGLFTFKCTYRAVGPRSPVPAPFRLGHGWNRSLLQRRCDGGCDVVSCGKPNAINHTQYGFINACESPNGFHGMVYHWVNTHTFEWKSHLFLPYMAGMIFFSPWADHSPRESMCLSCLIPGTRIGCIWNWGIPPIIAIY